MALYLYEMAVIAQRFTLSDEKLRERIINNNDRADEIRKQAIFDLERADALDRSSESAHEVLSARTAVREFRSKYGHAPTIPPES